MDIRKTIVNIPIEYIEIGKERFEKDTLINNLERIVDNLYYTYPILDSFPASYFDMLMYCISNEYIVDDTYGSFIFKKEYKQEVLKSINNFIYKIQEL